VAEHPTFRETLRYWSKLGWISFGGPTGQIAIMHKDLVERKKWIPEDHFLQALNFCMLLPGPEAQQLATYIGWLLHGTRGGLVAGVLFVLPAVFILWGLSWLYAAFGTIPAISALFYGLKPAVAAIVAEAVIRIGKKSLKNGVLVALAAVAFVGIFFLQIPFPVIVFASGAIGYLGGRYFPAWFATPKKGQAATAEAYVITDEMTSRRSNAGWGHVLKVMAICMPLWFAPVIALGLWRGWDDIFVHIGLLFSKAAVVTFGGAYAVLAYIGQQAVEHYGWLQPEQMMDGLGLAETTPGPLIMVTQFVGYMASYLHAGGLSPALAGAIGGLLTTWVTFVPCFMWIFAFAPYIERVRKNAHLGAALSAVTAAVVGVVLNLFVVFTRHMLLPEVGPHFDWYALAAAAVAFVGMQRWKWGMIPVIVGSALAGGAWKLFAS
jgi:chromate transporter